MNRGFAILLTIFSLNGLALFAASIGVDLLANQVIKKQSSTNNCTVGRDLGVFKGSDYILAGCLTSPKDSYSMFTNDVVTYTVAIQYVFIAFIGASIITELIAVAVGLYNLFSRPYQTFADIPAFILYFSITCGLSLLAIVMYIVLWQLEYPDSLPTDPTQTINMSALYEIESTVPDKSFYLLIGGFGANIIGIIVGIFAKKDATRAKKNEDFIEGPKGGNTNDIFSL